MHSIVRPTKALPWFAAGFALAALALVLPAPLWAQPADDAAMEQPAESADEEPAMTEEPATEEPAADEPAADEALGDEPPADVKPAAAARRRPARADDEEAAAAVPDDPAVKAVLESQPKTPQQLLRAIDILVDLGHAELAKPLVDQLTTSKLDLQAKAVLSGQFNSATLMKLAHDEHLSVVLGPFIDDLLKASDTFRRDAKRLAGWAKQLSDPDETIRAQATVALLRAREAAVAPLVAILADLQRTSEHRAAQRILLQLGELAVPPLLGVLESPNAELKVQVIEVLGRLQAAPATAQLLAPMLASTSSPRLRAAATAALAHMAGNAPTPSEALQLLEHAAWRGLRESQRDDDGTTAPAVLWHWNAKRQESMPLQYDVTGAALAESTRLARDLYHLDTTHAAHRRLFLQSLLQATKFRLGLDKPIPKGEGTAYAIAARQGADVLDDVLSDSIAKGYIPAATAAAQILGDIGRRELLTRGGAAPSPLVVAAQHADRRLRFAAIDAILKLKPTTPFAGSSRVVDGLGFFATSYGVPRVLVVHPRSDEAREMAGLAAELGYEADIATNGRRAFELAGHSADYQFALLHSTIDRPAVDELLAQFRRDRRTRLLPVGVVAPLEDIDRVQRFASNSSRAEAFLQPKTVDEMKLFSGNVLARGGRWHVSPAERQAQAIAALDWIATVGKQSNRVFDITRLEPTVTGALFSGDLAPRAIEVLGHLGTANGQRSLLEVANMPTNPLATRKAAVAALFESIHGHGIMLDSDEIRQQYSLYNLNGGRDADTHAISTAILDALEQKKTSATD